MVMPALNFRRRFFYGRRLKPEDTAAGVEKGTGGVPEKDMTDPPPAPLRPTRYAKRRRVEPIEASEPELEAVVVQIPSLHART